MTRIIILSASLLFCTACRGEEEPSSHSHHAAAPGEVTPLPALPDDARVFFVSPSDGAVVTGPLVDGKVEVRIEMGAKGIAVEPAGEVKAGSGHHHILIDVEDVAEGVAVPADDSHIHFGKGQTEATVALAPGSHRLALQFADGAHRSYGPAMTSHVTVEVEEEKAGDDDASDEAEDAAAEESGE